MKLPKFDSYGNLPERIYPCTKETLHQYFVAPFPASTERIAIYNCYCSLHKTVESLGINATQWIDGSFTTRKLDPANTSIELEPHDIDVVTFIDYDVLNTLPRGGQMLLRSLVDAQAVTKAKYRTHSFLVPSCAPGHPYYLTYEAQRANYRDLFSRHSPPSLRKPGDLSLDYPPDAPRKGIMSVTIGNPVHAPKINDTRL